MSLWRITIFGVIFVAVMMVWFFIIGFSSNQPGSYFNTGHNAIWIGHEWVDERRSDQDIQELVNNLSSHGIDTVFVHVGPLNHRGTIDPEAYKYGFDFSEVC